MPRKYTKIVIKTEANRFKNIPARAIWRTLTIPEPKITELGGVAAGSINAMEAERVPVIINNKGLMPAATEKAARIGNTISVVAVLEVNSVSMEIITAIQNVINNG